MIQTNDRLQLEAALIAFVTRNTEQKKSQLVILAAGFALSPFCFVVALDFFLLFFECSLVSQAARQFFYTL